MWNALRKKVNKASRSYNQSDDCELDSDGDGDTATGVILRRYARIQSYSEGLTNTVDPASTDPFAASVAPRYENPYASLDARATTTDPSATSINRCDNARHHGNRRSPSNDYDAVSHDRRNNNSRAEDTDVTDDVIVMTSLMTSSWSAERRTTTQTTSPADRR